MVKGMSNTNKPTYQELEQLLEQAHHKIGLLATANRNLRAEVSNLIRFLAQEATKDINKGLLRAA
jgi:hypothetical protein